MRDDDQDPELRGRFARLRREDEAGAPKFAASLREAERARGGRPLEKKLAWGVAAGAAVVMVVALGVAQRWLQWRDSPAGPAHALEASILDWTAPTDFLLETPGAELLRTTPALGRLPSVSSGAPAFGAPLEFPLEPPLELPINPTTTTPSDDDRPEGRRRLS